MSQDFGWLPMHERTREERDQHDQLVGEMPSFPKFGNSAGAKVLLWDYAKAANGGEHIQILRQQTGACVGHMAWAAAMYLSAMEIARLGESEQLKTLFLPYTYGRGRFHSGIGGRGEGSLGSGQAKAASQDGYFAQDAFEELPAPFDDAGGMTWGEEAEYGWSDGKKIANKYVSAGKLHPVKSTALVVTYEQVRDAIANGYPVGVCSMVGFEHPGKVDADGKCWGVQRGRWPHAMTFIGVDDNPARPGCYCLNSWGPSGGAGPRGPWNDGAPPGGFWVDDEIVERMVRERDSFAYSQFEGFPAQNPRDWGIF